MCSLCTKYPDLAKLDDATLRAALAEIGVEMGKLSHKRRHDEARAHLEKLIGTALGIDEGTRDERAERIYEERRRN
jgi:hypothetical protein